MLTQATSEREDSPPSEKLPVEKTQEAVKTGKKDPEVEEREKPKRNRPKWPRAKRNRNKNKYLRDYYDAFDLLQTSCQQMLSIAQKNKTALEPFVKEN